MDKLAQNRSVRSRIWENVNLTGKALEGLHPEFKQLMVKMRNTDKVIRESANDVRPAVRYARSALRQRDYLNAAHFITAFHQRLRFVAYHLNKFLQNVDVDHFNYLLKNFKNRHKDQIFDYDPNAEIKEACQQFNELTKEAGVYDWLKDKALHIYDFTTDTASNIVSNKGRSRRLLDKRFNVGFMKDLKEETADMVAESVAMLKDLMRAFDELESGVSRRNPGLYIEGAKEFVKMFNDYHKKFEKFHAKIVVPLKNFKEQINKEETQRQDAIRSQQEATIRQQEAAARQQAEEQAAQQAAQERAEMEDAENTVFVSPERFVPQESPEKVKYIEPSFEQWKKAPSKEETESVLNHLDKEHKPSLFLVDESEDSPKSEKPNQPERKHPKAPLNLKINPENDEMDESPPSKAASSNDFLNQLSIYADSNDANSFIKEILVYSELVEAISPEQSGELLSIANEILVQQKTAGFWDRIRGKKAPIESPKTQELQRGTLNVKSPPSELVGDITEEDNKYKLKQIDIPDGTVNEAYSNLSFLANIGPDRIRISPESGKNIINNFLRVLSINLGQNADKYVPAVRKNLISLIKQAIYGGLVTSIDGVSDVYNPNDRYLEVYNRFQLSQIDPSLTGYAKLYMYCRVSPNKGIVSVRNIKKHFEIIGLNPSKPSPPTNQSPPPSTKNTKQELAEEYDDDLDRDQFDDPLDYYDTDY